MAMLLHNGGFSKEAVAPAREAIKHLGLALWIMNCDNLPEQPPAGFNRIHQKQLIKKDSELEQYFDKETIKTPNEVISLTESLSQIIIDRTTQLKLS